MLTRLYVRAQNAMVNDEGATAVEYGLMVALIALVIVAAVAAVGQNLITVFNSVPPALS